jgi:hypothetical protein
LARINVRLVVLSSRDEGSTVMKLNPAGLEGDVVTGEALMGFADDDDFVLLLLLLVGIRLLGLTVLGRSIFSSYGGEAL